MKKIYYLVLVLPILCLAGCSFQNKNIDDQSNLQDNQINTPVETGTTTDVSIEPIVDTQNNIADTQNNENQKIIYRNEDYRFQVIFPSTWKDYVVKSEKKDEGFDDKKYSGINLSFGFPVTLKSDGNEFTAEKCDSCYTEVFSLFIMSKINSQNLEIARQADIAKNGGNPVNNQYFILASNNEYVIYGPSNYHGQSYDGEFIASRQTEAQNAVYNQFTTWNKYKFPNQ